MYYDGGSYMKSEFNQYKDNENIWHLHLACEDDMQYTFKKTWMAYRFIADKYSPDWIFRTNTSTYVNIRVLNDFILNHADPKSLMVLICILYLKLVALIHFAYTQEEMEFLQVRKYMIKRS